MRAYIDSDILIWHLRGEDKATQFLRVILNDNRYECWIGAMQRAEIVFFMRPEEETMTMLFLSQFKTAPVNQQIVDAAALLYRTWYKSHGIDINDAFLAATALDSGGTVFTLNIKHYPMPELLVVQAWDSPKTQDITA